MNYNLKIKFDTNQLNKHKKMINFLFSIIWFTLFSIIILTITHNIDTDNILIFLNCFIIYLLMN